MSRHQRTPQQTPQNPSSETTGRLPHLLQLQSHQNNELDETAHTSRQESSYDSQFHANLAAIPVQLKTERCSMDRLHPALPLRHPLHHPSMTVQFDHSSPDGASLQTPLAIQNAAAEGIKESGQALPHIKTIQTAFGHHDVQGINAHIGGSAATACETMGAGAFATGHHVGFRNKPDLHTAAHEAAHVIQQRGGVQLRHGVGETGDRYEIHANQVADKVVQGESAETLLDQQIGPKTAPQSMPVQADVGFEFQTFQSKSGFYRYGKKHKTDLVKHNDHGVYAKKPTWQVENDGGDIEVVIERVSENKSGRESLQKTFAEIRAFFQFVSEQTKVIKTRRSRKGTSLGSSFFVEAGSIYKQWDSGDINAQLEAPHSKQESSTDLQSRVENYFILIADNLKAHPQVTAGFRLEKLLEVFELLGAADYGGEKTIGSSDTLEEKKKKLANELGFFKPNEDIYGRHQDTIKDSASAVKGMTGMDDKPRLKGFLTLIGSYIRGWQKNVKKDKHKKYAKNFTPIMSRTNLAHIVFYGLSPEERLAFTEKVKTDTKQEALLQDLNIDKSVLTKPLFGHYADDIFTFPQKYKHISDNLKALGFTTGMDITVQDFLFALAALHSKKKGYFIDLTSEGYGAQAMGTQAGEKALDLGLSEKDIKAGATTSTSSERDQERKKGVAVELRRLRENVPLEEWESFALTAFDLTVMINEGEDPKDWT